MYAAISDVALRPYADASSPLGFSMDVAPNVGGGLVALRLSTGKEAWRAKPADACGVRKANRVGRRLRVQMPAYQE